MNPDKEKAFELRRSIKSYKAIHKELGIPLSTLSGWFKNEEWSTEIRDRLGKEQSLSFPKKLEAMVKANKERWGKIHQSYRDAAEKEFESLKDNPLFLAGIMLYWGEGEKKQKSSAVRLSNSEPEMIRIFNIFLTKTLKIPQNKIWGWLLLYPDLVDSVQKNFWSKATGLSLGQFTKSTYIKGRHPSKRLSYGVCTIIVRNRALKERVLKWLELYQNYLRSNSFNTLEKLDNMR